MVMIMDETDGEDDELTTYSVNDDLSLPYLFDGVDETLDDGDAVMNVDQQICADPEEEVRTDLDATYLVGTAETRSAEVDLYDSGTTRHMSGFYHRLFNYVETKPVPIITADKRPFHAIGKGDMYVYLPNRDKSNSRILLKDVLYAPDMGITLVSISRIAGAGATVVFTGNVCRIYSKDREVIGEIKVKGGLYRVFMSGTEVGAFVVDVKEMSINELHRRLGHVSHERARLLVKKGLVEGVTLETDSQVVVCESCEWAKGERKVVYKVRENQRRTAIGDEVHSDLWGPAPVESINHKRYYVSFTDDYSRYTNIYFLHTKDETFNAYRTYEAWLSNQYNTKVKTLRSDQGGEYLSVEFSAHLKKAGTIRKLTVHDTPEHNGVAERLNRTLLEKVRAMLHESDLPKFLWAEAAVRLMLCTSKIGHGHVPLGTQHLSNSLTVVNRMLQTFSHGVVRSESTTRPAPRLMAVLLWDAGWVLIPKQGMGTGSIGRRGDL